MSTIESHVRVPCFRTPKHSLEYRDGDTLTRATNDVTAHPPRTPAFGDLHEIGLSGTLRTTTVSSPSVPLTVRLPWIGKLLNQTCCPTG
jgi:hypothetical protein